MQKERDKAMQRLLKDSQLQAGEDSNLDMAMKGPEDETYSRSSGTTASSGANLLGTGPGVETISESDTESHYGKSGTELESNSGASSRQSQSVGSGRAAPDFRAARAVRRRRVTTVAAAAVISIAKPSATGIMAAVTSRTATTRTS